MGQYRHLLESSPGFTLGAALEFTESDFREDFADVWGLDAKSPPAGMAHDDWLACRRVYGMARQVADVAMLLVRQKGVGANRLAVGSQLEAEARAHDRSLSELLEVVKTHLGPQDAARVRDILDRPSGDDPRSRRDIFVNTLQVAARSIFPPTLDEVALRMEAPVDR